MAAGLSAPAAASEAKAAEAERPVALTPSGRFLERRCHTQQVGLISGLAFGGVALLAVGASEYKGGLAICAVVLLLVGPVAYGGLLFSMRQLSSFFSMKPRDAGMTTKPAVAEAQGAPGTASSPSLRKRAGSSAPRASPAKSAAAVGCAGSAVEGRPNETAPSWTFEDTLGLIPKAWRSFPSSAETLQGASDLWRWLNNDRWKPFPWSWLPDPIAFLWGVAEIAFMAPIFAIEIVVTVPLMTALRHVWRHRSMAAFRTGVPEMVRSVSRPLGRLMLLDARNHSYIPWMLLLGTCIPGLFFWAMRQHAEHGLELSTLCIYHICRVGPRMQFFAHIHTLVHKEGHAHRGFFKGAFQCLNCANEWWIGPFYGVVPWNYHVAHMKIHHRWHNDVDDVHTNLDLDRTNPLSFFLYTPRFTLYWTGLSPIALFVKRKEWFLLQQLLAGQVAYYGVTALLFRWNPTFCFIYWIFPHIEACVILCGISYMWHAFVEVDDPGNQYVNSVTILDGHDNVWNEDYHVVHHHAPNTHWSDAPAHFERNRDKYAAVTATIFRDTEEGKLLQWMFERNWDAMAEHFVDLNGKLSHAEKKALIVRRLSVIVGAEGRDGKRVEWASTSSIRDFVE